jgi:hypothetical protein
MPFLHHAHLCLKMTSKGESPRKHQNHAHAKKHQQIQPIASRITTNTTPGASSITGTTCTQTHKARLAAP